MSGTMPAGKPKWWISRDTLLIALSAFFADMGYQAILAGFPVLLVLLFGAPAYILGIVYAITYGGGAVFGYVGGRLGDSLGRKKIAVLGNILILLLPGIGLVVREFQAVALYVTGWWSRELRTPPRRAMLFEAAKKQNSRRAFGMLHALDIGGGAIAVSYLAVLLYLKLSLQDIFLLTALPLVVSTICLLFVKVGRNRFARALEQKRPLVQRAGRSTLSGVLIATAMFGFSSYSLGFPILTIAQEAHSSILGILSYAVYLALSAATGYVIGVKASRMNMVKGLSFLGYLLAALASLLMGMAYAFGLGTAVSYIAVALLGIALGSIETFEPTIIALISSARETSSKMGYLTASRSIGLFTANISMGLLYMLSPAYSYFYAFVVSLAASAVLLYMGRGFSR